MRGKPTSFWGKLEQDKESGVVTAWHPLEDHCADVAACAEALLRETLLGRRLAALGGQGELDEHQLQRLCAFAALHDVGKFNIGFQNKAFPGQPTAGHVAEVASLFDSVAPEGDRLVEALGADAWETWAEARTLEGLLFASICHHGRPASTGGSSISWIWRPTRTLDPFDGIRQLVARIRRWFPCAFEDGGLPLPDSHAFQHAFSGLVTLADWLGSDTTSFPYSEELGLYRMKYARSTASTLLRSMGLSTREARASLGRTPLSFEKIFAFPPKGAQGILSESPAPHGPSLTILEAETGAGKTEAALYRFLQLFQQGAVDGMYFALPTRTAATQIYERVQAAVERAFPNQALRPPVILAVPGYLRVDGFEGRRAPLLGPFEVLWNDSPDERFRFRTWAAESSKRYLAAPIAVGTIDQVLLASLQVSHSHLRATSLLRQFLVVDEVHASDRYMNRLLEALLNRHRDAGGHALLMSATLGSTAGHRFLRPAGEGPPPTAQEAEALPFPLLRHRVGESLQQYEVPAGRGKRVRIETSPVMEDAEAIVADALQAARGGAKVLILRNTVQSCLETQRALERVTGTDSPLLLRCAGVPTPHHSRYTPEDRRLLDKAIEAALGKSRLPGGLVAVATQTVQQSLDLDADWLLTDLCPVDVLLQRIGRLHRHVREARPLGFEAPQVRVLVPARRDLGALIGRNGKAFGPSGLGSVYEDLTILEATWRLVDSEPCWLIPEANRRLVERGTHPEILEAIAKELGDPWQQHRDHIMGKGAAEGAIAALGLVPWDRPYGACLFPSDLDERISTRLGEGDRRLLFEEPLPGPFGGSVRELRLPAHFAKGLPTEATPEKVECQEGRLSLVFGGKAFRYDRLGLRPLKTEKEDDLAEA